VTRSDVLIVGGGPAGSSCAWSLVRAGLTVTVIDRAAFPRDKVCAGWITPPVLDELAIDVADYRATRTFQPIAGFCAGVIGRRSVVDVSYPEPISYGIRRCEFDHYLLARSGAHVASGEPVRGVRRSGGLWMIDDRYAAPVLVGAGGHFCPVARMLGAAPGVFQTVAAQEAEFELGDEALRSGAYRTDPERPELYFSPDFRGYGWCFRKGAVVNIGFGSLVTRGVARAVEAFAAFLRGIGRVPGGATFDWRGHAYRLYESAPRRVVGDGVLLVGDAAALAYPESGEGIRPAVESGLLAAATIVRAGGGTALDAYDARLRARFGAARDRGVRAALPPGVVAAVGRELIRLPWFVRRVVLNRWFLRAGDRPLVP
jgi:flavin-dependent dehydrogenase